MGLRINTATQFEQSIANLQKRQRDLVETQDQLTSGKRISKASDDPTAAAVAERALAVQSRVEVSERALQASRNIVNQAESALGDANDLLQRFRELTVQLGNGSYDTKDRNQLLVELQGLRDQVLQVANRADSAGQFLFAGQGSEGAPFVESFDNNGEPQVSYEGTSGALRTATTEGLPISVDGQETWMVTREGASSVERSVFQVMDTLLKDLGPNPTLGVTAAQAVETALADIDASMSNISAARARLGGLMNQTDGIEQRLAAAKVAAQAERSNAEDLDLVQAISEFQTRQTSYDAALKAYSMVQKLSLFDYIT
jgi:flagellar hook-associated protein 3 FlgL